MNHFTIERNGRCWESAEKIVNNRVNMVSSRIDELKNATYEEMKSKHWIEGFIMAVMETADELSGTKGDQTIVTLLDENGVFIWSIIISAADNYEIDFEVNYAFVDWKKDGKSYRYVS
jgi:hypothetical protein